MTTKMIFHVKRVVVFSLPGAFTPTCSTSHLPRYEELHDEFKALGIDQIICLSVNDAFVMYQWGLSQKAKNVFLLPDGNGEFTRKMGMLVGATTGGMVPRIRDAATQLLLVYRYQSARHRNERGNDIWGK